MGNVMTPGNTHTKLTKYGQLSIESWCLIGILALVFYNLHILGSMIPYRAETTRFVFIAQLNWMCLIRVFFKDRTLHSSIKTYRYPWLILPSESAGTLLLGGWSQDLEVASNLHLSHLGHLEGEQPLTRGVSNHGCQPFTNWDDPPSIEGFGCVNRKGLQSPTTKLEMLADSWVGVIFLKSLKYLKYKGNWKIRV